MTWAEITAWNRGRQVARDGQLVTVWARLLEAVAPFVLSEEEDRARTALGPERFEYWLTRGASEGR